MKRVLLLFLLLLSLQWHCTLQCTLEDNSSVTELLSLNLAIIRYLKRTCAVYYIAFTASLFNTGQPKNYVKLKENTQSSGRLSLSYPKLKGKKIKFLKISPKTQNLWVRWSLFTSLLIHSRHIFQNTQVTSNKMVHKKRHHFLA